MGEVEEGTELRTLFDPNEPDGVGKSTEEPEDAEETERGLPRTEPMGIGSEELVLSAEFGGAELDMRDREKREVREKKRQRVYMSRGVQIPSQSMGHVPSRRLDSRDPCILLITSQLCPGPVQNLPYCTYSGRYCQAAICLDCTTRASIFDFILAVPMISSCLGYPTSQGPESNYSTILLTKFPSYGDN